MLLWLVLCISSSGVVEAGRNGRRVESVSATQIIKESLFRFGFYRAFRQLVPSRSLAILRYHAVCAPDGEYADPGICVPPEAFAEHVRYLADSYRVLSLREGVQALRRGLSLPRNSVAVTFDDGYLDNLHAARVLAGHGLTATFYITAGCVTDRDGLPFWPAELRMLVNSITSPFIELDVAGQPLSLPLQTPVERRAAIARLNKVFKGNTIPVREAVRDQLRLAADHPDRPSPMLSSADLIAMKRIGMEIGSHTFTHPNLPNAGAAAAESEIRLSKQRLEDIVNEPITAFSYPNGGAERYMTPAIAKLVREAGFESATTSRNAVAGPASDLYALERVQVSERLEEMAFALEVERYAFKPKARPGELA